MGLAVFFHRDLLHVCLYRLPRGSCARLGPPWVAVDGTSVLELDVEPHQLDGVVVVVRGQSSRSNPNHRGDVIHRLLDLVDDLRDLYELYRVSQFAPCGPDVDHVSSSHSSQPGDDLEADAMPGVPCQRGVRGSVEVYGYVDARV